MLRGVATYLDRQSRDKVIVKYLHNQPICPQADLYARMEASGSFQVFGIYDIPRFQVFDEERLCGFATVLVYVVPHYGRRIATVESLFLRAGSRNRPNGNALMDAVEGYAKEHGCEAILYSARTGSRFERLLSLLKPYERTNSVFLRCLRPRPG